MFLSVNGVQVDEATLHLPAQGCWVATARVADDVATSGPAALVIGDLTLAGSINPLRSGRYQTRTTLEVVGGLGWRNSVPARHYHNDAGIKRSTVLQGAAELVGETVSGAPTDRVGVDWVRPEGPASDTLNQLAPDWYMGLDGVTRATARPEVTEAGEGVELLAYDPANHLVTLKATSLAAVTIGTVLRSGLDVPQRVTSLDVLVRPGSLRIRAAGVDHV